MATVTIGCRLPCGIQLEHKGVNVVLNGQNTAAPSPIILLNEELCGYTEVDQSFWEAWKKSVKTGPEGQEVDFAPLDSQAIFEAPNQREAKAKAKDVKSEKTGHEPLSQNAKDIEKAD